MFVNCPFDDGYAPIFRALVFTIFACGFRARSAREVDDGGEARIEKLYRIIEQCRYGIHDLSRTELDAANGLPRFNMPLELGIFLGSKRFGQGAQRLKRVLLLDIDPHRYEVFISDLKGMDIQDHGGAPNRAVQRTRDWLANVSRRKIAGTALVVDAHDRFAADLPQIATSLGFQADTIPYVDFEGMVTSWLLEST